METEFPATDHGFVLARDMRAIGREQELVTAVRSGALERVRRGVYARPCPPEEAARSKSEQDRNRYLRLVRASSLVLQRPIYTSYSALVLAGLPIVGPWPREVYVLSRDAHGHRRNGVVEVARTHAPEHATSGGLATTSMEHSLVQLCRQAPLAAALTATDAAARVSRGFGSPPPLITLDDLRREHDRLRPYPGSRRTDAVITRATTDADTPLETMSRLVIEEFGFAPPVLQHELWLPELERLAYLDFYWPEVRAGAEADGRGKYRGVHVDASVERVIAEKDRENAIRRQLDGFARWDWPEMWRRHPIEERLRQAGVPRVRRPSRLIVLSDAPAFASPRASRPALE